MTCHGDSELNCVDYIGPWMISAHTENYDYFDKNRSESPENKHPFRFFGFGAQGSKDMRNKKVSTSHR